MLEVMALHTAVRMGSVEHEKSPTPVRYEHHVTLTTETPLPAGMNPLLMPDAGTQGASPATTLRLLVSEAQAFVRELPVGEVDPNDDAIVEALVHQTVEPLAPRRLTRRYVS
jgi:hypothetical protein